jgi:peptide/nickel transport system permease protein
VLGYLIKRTFWALALMLTISFFTYILFFIAPSQVHIGKQAGGGVTSLTAQYEFTGQPVPEAYARFVWSVLRHGDLGQSFTDGESVLQMIKKTLPVTAALVIGGSILWIVFAFSIGLLSALRPRSLLDRASMMFVLVGVSAHPVWIGLILSWFLGFKLHIFPIAGYCDFFHPQTPCGGAAQWFWHMMLPWVTYAFLFAALYARMIRATVLENLNEDYVRTAEAKGAGRARIIRSHVLRNALLPLVTMFGMDVGLAFGGALFVEQVYNLPGMGQMMYQALARRDLPVIMGVVLLVSLAVVVMNTIVDLLYRSIDPRMRVTDGRTRVFRLPRLPARQLAVRPRQSPTI